MIAIDPGVCGGIAYVDSDGSIHAFAMPETLKDIQRQLEILITPGGVVFLEELPKFAGKMSASSMGTMFRNYGRIEGLIAAYGVRIEYLPPKKWQSALGLGNKKTHGDRWKAHLKGRAQVLYPHLTVTLKTADALLILEAGQKLSR
jgi:hypothetical protein